MRALKYVIYVGLLLGTLALGAARWRVLLVLFASDASYFSDIPFLPLWLPLGLGVVGYLIYFLVGAALRLRIGLKHHVVVLVLLGAVITARIVETLAPAADQQRWVDLEDAPPHWLMARAAGRLGDQLALHFARSHNRTYPTDPEVLQQMLDENGQPPPSGFRRYGFRLPIRLVVVQNAEDAVRRVRLGDRPGTLVYAVSADARNYWITAVGLTAYPIGEPKIMAGPDREALVVQP